jgi:hypothetical protein
MTTSLEDPRGREALPAMAAVQRLSRRHFLQAAAALSAGSASGALLASAPAMKFIGHGEAAVFQRLMEVTLPVAGTPLLPLSQVPVMQTLDAALLGTMAPHVLAGLKGGVGYWNEGPRTEFKRSFIQLNDEEATRFCDQWANGTEIPQRALSMGLKKLVALSYFANPPTWKPLGYDGPYTRPNNIPSLGNAPLPKGGAKA